jgi:hypothetical protein
MPLSFSGYFFLSPSSRALIVFRIDSQGSGFAVTLGYTLSPLRGSLVARFAGFIEILSPDY